MFTYYCDVNICVAKYLLCIVKEQSDESCLHLGDIAPVQVGYPTMLSTQNTSQH